MKKICVEILCLIFILTAAVSNGQGALSEKISSELLENFQLSPGQPQTFLVYLYDQETENLIPSSYLESLGREERGAVVGEVLKWRAEVSQGEILKYLAEKQRENKIVSFRSFHIINAIKVEAGLEVARDLAARYEVERIDALGILYSKSVDFNEPEEFRNNYQASGEVQSNIQRIGAPQLWAEGITGKKIIVADIGGGVDYNHPAIVNQYACEQGPHDYCWFDAVERKLSPKDDTGRGTHSMGIAVGNNGIGVAPGAKWIACRACSYQGCKEEDLLECAEWIIAPTDLSGKHYDYSKMAHIVNNSWIDNKAACSDWFGRWFEWVVKNWRAYGIFSTFPAGDSGPYMATIPSASSYPVSFTTGAVHSNDDIYEKSSRGPSLCSEEIKPDIVAPGVGIYSSIPRSWGKGEFMKMSGTMPANAHTTGCVALIRSVFPSLPIGSIENALKTSAKELGEWGSDYDYGYGRLNCYRAIRGHEEELKAYIVNSESSISESKWNGKEWSDWSPLSIGGIVNEAPAASQRSLWVRGTDNALYQALYEKYRDYGWSGWTRFEVYATSAPAIIWHENTFHVFVTGSDHALYQKYFPTEKGSGKWSDWIRIDARILGSPALAVYDGQLHVFVIGSDHALYQMYWDGSQWNGWYRLGGYVIESPAAISHDGQLYVFVTGSDHSLYQKVWDPALSWSGWKNLGGYISKSPSAAVYKESLLVTATGGDQAIWWRKMVNNDWSEWQSLGGYTLFGPSITASY